MTERRIGVLMGGTSAEREVSLKSGRAVSGALGALGYDVVDIDVGPEVCLELRKEKIEVAFVVLHGGHGEDGSIQGMLEVMGIPYTGSGVLASAMAMDKLVSKVMFISAGIRVPDYQVLRNKSEFPTVALPAVIKPAGEGSSIGVSIVREPDQLKPALEQAFLFGPAVLVEKYIDGREIQIGVLDGRALGGVEVRPNAEFYSFEAKYTAGMTEYVLPPEIDGETYVRLKDIAVSAHEALGCRGASRVDLLLDSGGEAFVLEVNTIPGMTETSLLPKIAAQAGLNFPALLESMLKDALEQEDKE